MRKLLRAAVFIVFLSLAPAFAGHMVAGGAYCECPTPGCMCDSNVGPMAAQYQNKPSDLGSESLLVLAALMLWLRLRA